MTQPILNAPELNFVNCPHSTPGSQGTHRMAYWQWGDPQAGHVVLCVHGLSRQGRDFDVLAKALLAASSHPLRVICPDVVGRGQSDWLQDPMGYQLPQYGADMLALMHALKPTTVDWVGTSMGGLIGIGLCGQPQLLPGPVRRLVLNDIGPNIQWEATQRIGTYLGQPVRFESAQQAADVLWSISSSFGPHTPEQWLALSGPMIKPALDGEGFVLHYDPKIALPFKAITPKDAELGQATLWTLYDQIQAKTLLVRGALSDLLSPQTALEMTQRGPKAQLLEFAGVGHAPTFVPLDQVQAVCDFLFDQP
jgi:pimeloyl-ACP methyl ester carboxylesterase